LSSNSIKPQRLGPLQFSTKNGTPSDGELDDETLLLFTVFVGVMFGAATAGKILGDIAERLASQTIKRLPQRALTKWGVYNLAKQVAKWIGVRLTKQSFARVLAKILPIVSGFLSGGISWVSFSRMSKRLRERLETLHPHLDDSV
jgi:hypothetical protein